MPWIPNLINVGGWTALVTATWKIALRFFSFNEKISKTEETVVALATNHIPHIQIELEKANAELAYANRITQEGFDRMADAVQGLRTDLMIIAAVKK